MIADFNSFRQSQQSNVMVLQPRVVVLVDEDFFNLDIDVRNALFTLFIAVSFSASVVLSKPNVHQVSA